MMRSAWKPFRGLSISGLQQPAVCFVCVGCLLPAPEVEDSSQPSWMAEIAARRKSKAYLQPLKPEVPIKLVETPQWKKELAEKKKLRRESQCDLPLSPQVRGHCSYDHG